LPADEPARPKPGWGDVVRDVASRIGVDAPENSQDTSSDGNKEDKKSGSSAAGDISDMYSKGIEKFRDNIKWFVLAAGAVAAALVGTAPLAGAAQSLRAAGLDSASIGLFASVVAIALVLVVAAWTLQPLEASLPQLAKRDWWWRLPLWRHGFQDEYARNWMTYLDGVARNLQEYRDYRAAWLGTLADIERDLERATDLEQQKKLKAYRTLAKERLKLDEPNLALTLWRGTARQTRRRTQVAIAIITALVIIAAGGFIVYLRGAGTPPVITSLKASENLMVGQPFTLTVEATGTGFRYTWWHDDGEPIPGATGPVLEIDSYGADTAGTYKVRVAASDGTADVDEIDVPPPPPPSS
jgi:hypothetical protein